MTNKDEEKRQLETALSNLKITDDIEKAEQELNKHIGFTEEKNTFLNHIKLYKITGGSFWPKKEVVCYVGAPGMGKTTFVITLANAMSRPYETVSLSGFKESEEYSVFGDENKPSLVAWAIKKNGCKNPVILLDELEKAEDPKIQAELLELFEKYKNKEKFTDQYFQKEIELEHITFFATVNWIDDLNQNLKEKIKVNELPDFTHEEKEKILAMKAKEINEKYPEKKGGIITGEIIREILNHIREVGVRQTERVLYKIEEEYLHSKTKGEKFTITENPHAWIKKNVFPYQEEFQANWRHYCLFLLFGINFLLLMSWVFKRFILKNEIEGIIKKNSQK
jgi:ATP-dependent Lon protease